jgi:hypothetical protein
MDTKETLLNIQESIKGKVDSLNRRQKLVGDVSIGKILNVIRALPTYGILSIAALTAWAGWKFYENAPLRNLVSEQNRVYDAVPVNPNVVCGLGLPTPEEQKNHPRLKKTLEDIYYGSAERNDDGKAVYMTGLQGIYPDQIRKGSTLYGNWWMSLEEFCRHIGEQKNCGALSDPVQWNPDTSYMNTYNVGMLIAPFNVQQNAFDPLRQITWPEDAPHGAVVCGKLVK